jgi:hypothetical protein
MTRSNTGVGRGFPRDTGEPTQNPPHSSPAPHKPHPPFADGCAECERKRFEAPSFRRAERETEKQQDAARIGEEKRSEYERERGARKR